MKHSIFLITLLVLSLMLSACASGAAATISSTDTVVSSGAASEAQTQAASVSNVASSASAGQTLAENSATHEAAEDYAWDSAAAIPITLSGDAISAGGSGVAIAGASATITAAGAYELSGTLADGQIVVDTADEQTVWLILNGVDIHNADSAAISIVNAEKVVIVLAAGAQNSLSDGAEYVFASAEEDEPNATLFSKADLTLTGEGSLTVSGNYNDGIASKDGLVIAGGSITVNAVDDGIRGKDYLLVRNAALAVSAQGDGLKSDNEEDASLGYIAIESGMVQVNAGGDAITAQSDVVITGGEFALTSGGGSSARIAETLSAKGIKGVASVSIEAGVFTIDSADDALHSNGSLILNGGTFTLSTGDDGIHSDVSLTINDGDIQITRSYEGIESALITLNGGNIHVTASDDGINVAGGVDGSGMMGPGGRQKPGEAQQDAFSYTGSYYLYIHGGYIVVEADGDGIDVNGAIEMSAGVVLVNGPTEQMNGALDYDGGFTISGGFLAAAGSSGMAQAPGAYSSQNSALIYLNNTQSAGTLIRIQNSAGEDIVTFAPSKAYQSFVFSSAQLAQGGAYQVYIGGSSTGARTDSLYSGGAYSPGSEYASFTVSGAVTQVGAGGGRMRP